MKTETHYKSDAGASFDNEHDAHADDLRHWLCDAAGNDPIARQIMKAITADTERFAAIVADMASSAPVKEPELPLAPAVLTGAETLERFESRYRIGDGLRPLRNATEAAQRMRMNQRYSVGAGPSIIDRDAR